MSGRKIFIIISAALLSSCSLTPEYSRPVVEIPQDWRQAQADERTEIARDWWKSFGSGGLDRLMDLALEGNSDLRAGIHRIGQARAALKIAGATLYPDAGASAGAERSRSNPASGKTESATSLRAGLAVAYELDLFGGNRAGVAAARAGLLASGYDQEALALVVMGEVAQTYFTLLNLRERLEIANDNLANSREIIRIIEARVSAGAESELELAQQRASVASSEAARAVLTGQIRGAENALSVLAGMVPQDMMPEERGLAEITLPEIAAGQPSALLERRPDIRSAEAALLAANADIGAARAAFFPSVSLGMNSAVSMAGFGDPSATAVSLASSLAAPLFRGGRLEGGLERATERQLELAENYRKAVLVAFREVEDALAAQKTAKAREAALATAMAEARKAYRISRQRYDAGAIDFQTLLDTQRAQLTSEDNHSQAKLSRLLAAVDLFMALGGGWGE